VLCIRKILENKCEYNEAVHQPFIDFEKACDSFRREVLYNILIEFGIPIKVARLIKCVSKWNLRQSPCRQTYVEHISYQKWFEIMRDLH